MTDAMRAALEKRGRVWGQPPQVPDRQGALEGRHRVLGDIRLTDLAPGLVGSGSYLKTKAKVQAR